MKSFTIVTGKALPLDRANVDTDAIIPKQYLKSIRRTGFGPFLFDDWRYLDPGTLDIDPATRRINREFVLNNPEHDGANILLARENFGCGSSREHAVWAIDEYGFRCVIAPSFADIFYDNCCNNGVLPVVLEAHDVDALFDVVARDADAPITVDLAAQHVRLPDGQSFVFEIDPDRKEKLLKGLDSIGETLQHADDIRAYEVRRATAAPWLFTQQPGGTALRNSVFDLLKALPGPPSERWPDGERYVRAFEHGSMSLGLYAPTHHDPQSPHRRDEIYIVFSGHADFVMAGERSACKAGDALFVAAGVEHRFENCAPNFATWVVFWGPQGGEPDAAG